MKVVYPWRIVDNRDASEIAHTIIIRIQSLGKAIKLVFDWYFIHHRRISIPTFLHLNRDWRLLKLDGPNWWRSSDETSAKKDK